MEIRIRQACDEITNIHIGFLSEDVAKIILEFAGYRYRNGVFILKTNRANHIVINRYKIFRLSCRMPQSTIDNIILTHIRSYYLYLQSTQIDCSLDEDVYQTDCDLIKNHKIFFPVVHKWRPVKKNLTDFVNNIYIYADKRYWGGTGFLTNYEYTASDYEQDLRDYRRLGIIKG